MKRFWKKANRGLILGLVLVIGLSGFIVFKNIRFQKEIPAIQTTAKEYLEQLLNWNLLPDATVGESLSDTQKEKKRAEMEAILQKYWADVSEDETKYGLTMSSLREQAAETLEGKVTTVFREYTLSLPEKSIHVSGNGPDYASVQISVENLSVDFCGLEKMLFFGDAYGSDNGYGYSYEVRLKEDEVFIGNDFTTPKQGEVQGYVQFELKRVDGEWKIIGAEGNFWISAVHITTSDADKNESAKKEAEKE